MTIVARLVSHPHCTPSRWAQDRHGPGLGCHVVAGARSPWRRRIVFGSCNPAPGRPAAGRHLKCEL